MKDLSKRAQLGTFDRKRKNKYNARKSKGFLNKDRWFDSKAEADYGDVLRAREIDGEIAELEFQPQYDLTCDIKYKADFAYVEVKTGRRVTVDVKGAETDRFSMIKKLWRYHGPNVLEIVKRSGSNQPFRVTKSIMPLQKNKEVE